MIDLEQLNEALSQYDDGEAGTHQVSELAIAARAYRDLLANGQRATLIQSEWKYGNRIWTLAMDGDVDGPLTGRYVVSKLLSVYPKEAENE